MTNDRKIFNLDEHIESLNLGVEIITPRGRRKTFEDLCDDVLNYFNTEVFDRETGDNQSDNRILERQRKAIIGEENEVMYFKNEIRKYLSRENLLGFEYPDYYDDLVSAIFHHNWGLGEIASWNNVKDSSAAKIVGGRIFHLIDGKMELQDQVMSKDRFEQLKTALLLSTPMIKGNLPYYEIYMVTGERITIYTKEFTKEGQDIMIFRRYLVDQYNFKELANWGTIPHDSVNMFKQLSMVGYNVVFSGAVGTGKTTFLTTWQGNEDPTLEGVMVETDPEIPLHEILPEAPIMQLIADDEKLVSIVKNLMRSDSDYLIMAESRDGYAINLAVEMANRGTRRSKTTIHLTNIEDICYDMAQKIVSDVGGNLDYTITKVAKSFHYVVELIKLPDKSQKRVKGVYELRYDSKTYEISIRQIMKYDIRDDSWSFYHDIDEHKEEIAYEENYEAFERFNNELKVLSQKYPMSEKDKENRVIVPFYSKMLQKSLE